MKRLGTSQLEGCYGVWRKNPDRWFAAIGLGRIIEAREGRRPKMLDSLLLSVETRSVGDYRARARTLAMLGIKGYRQYLQTELWEVLRMHAMDRTKGLCEFCGVKASQVHHSSYDISVLMGADLTRLHPTCGDCHTKIEFDGERKRTFEEARILTEQLAGW